MNRAIIDLQDFTVLIEEANYEQSSTETCYFDEPVIGVAFYGSGDVELTVKFGDKKQTIQHTKGLALSFYADDKVEFQHLVSASKPLECVVIATSVRNMVNLPAAEDELFRDLLRELVEPSDHFVTGPKFFMTPEMQSIAHQVFHSKYAGKAQLLFFRSQITSLMAHYFGQLSIASQEIVAGQEQEKLMLAKEILSDNLENPPSLSELSRLIGLNTFKLKKEFKELFGVPVFKYLQHQRLTKAQHLLRNEKLSIQEVAWQVGYDSLGSFSNAFVQKFGFRPSELKT